MRIWQSKIYLKRHLGIDENTSGKMAVSEFNLLVKEVNNQLRVERYPLEYRLGQIMCTLVNTKKRTYNPEQFVGEEPKSTEVTKVTKEAGKFDVTLADGKTYTLAVLDVNMMEDIEEEFDKSWGELFTNIRVKVVKTVLWHMLKCNYPEIQKADVGRLVTAKNLPDLVIKIGEFL